MSAVFGKAPKIPDAPAPVAPPPSIAEADPEEVARRRAAKLKKQVSRDALVINPSASGPNGGVGLRIGQ